MFNTLIQIVKKLILTLAICLLWSANVFAEENKWKYEDRYLTAKCFVNEWVSSDNFEEFYDRYFPAVKNRFSGIYKDMSPEQQSNDFFKNIGKFFPKSIPINEKFEPSWGGEQLSLTTNLNDCSSKKDFKVDKSEDFYFIVDDTLVHENAISFETNCLMLAPEVIIVAKAKCLDIKTVGYTTVFTGGTLPSYVQYNTYGIFNYQGDNIILPLKFNVELIKIKENPKVLRSDFFKWLSVQNKYTNMNQLKWDDDFKIYISKTYLDKSYRDRIEAGLNGPPNRLKYYDNKRYLSGSACKQSECPIKTLVWFDTKEEKSIALIYNGYEKKPEFTIISYDYDKLPKYFITAVKDWMIIEDVEEPKKINLKYKDNKIKVLNNSAFK